MEVGSIPIDRNALCLAFFEGRYAVAVEIGGGNRPKPGSFEANI